MVSLVWRQSLKKRRVEALSLHVFKLSSRRRLMLSVISFLDLDRSKDNISVAKGFYSIMEEPKNHSCERETLMKCLFQTIKRRASQIKFFSTYFKIVGKQLYDT